MIIKIPGVCGGSAIIESSRIPVWTIIKCLTSGFPKRKIIMNFAGLTKENIDDCIDYYSKNKKEIDLDIKENEEA
jgi:uncharacterized protein (DUF433 family)